MQCAYYPHARVQLDTGDVSMTKQSFKDECDINFIMKKFEKTGLLDHVNKFNGYYGDLPENVDYQTALNSVFEAEAAFRSLTADIRSKFHNDAGEFLAFVEDAENAEEIIALGLGPQPSSEPAPADLLAKASPAAPTPGEGGTPPVEAPAAP